MSSDENTRIIRNLLEEHLVLVDMSCDENTSIIRNLPEEHSVLVDMSSEENTSIIRNLPEEHSVLVDMSSKENTSIIRNLPEEHLVLVDISSEEGKSIIHNLPEEVLLKIFSYLSQYELFVNVKNVCSLWKNYSLSSSLWKHIDVQKELADFNMFLSQSKSSLLLESIVEAISCHVVSLTLETDLYWKIYNTTLRCYEYKDKTCTFAFPKLHKLEMDMSSKYIYLTDFEKIAQLTNNLKMLKLICNDICVDITSPIDVCHLRSLEKLDLTVEIDEDDCDIQISNDNLQKLFQNVSNITHFKATYLNSDTVRTLLNNCSSLEGLTLCDCPDIGQDAFDSIPLLNNMKSWSINRTYINDNDLKAIVQNTPNLEHLSVQQSVYITDVGFSFVGIHCKKLKCLFIEKYAYSRGRNITNIGLDHIACGCPDLEVIVAKYCEGIDDNGVQSLAKNCGNLLSLKLSGCPGVTDTGIDDLSNKCRYLEHVNFNKCVKITHKSINRLISKCLWLKTAKFNSCNFIYNLDFRSFTREQEANKQNTERDLKYRTILNAHNMTQNIGQHSHIRKLSLKFCPNLDGNSIKQIADYCPDLREVYLTGTHIVSDDAIHYLLQKCLSIRILDISGGSTLGTSKFTNTVLSSVGTHGKSIEKLIMCKNYNITKSGVLELLHASQRAITLSLTVTVVDNTCGILSLKDCQQLLAEYGNTRATLQYQGDRSTYIGSISVNIKKK
ncbi:F-box/LRR-repeat protein 7-like [Mytilus californianus]|uniref:F-box/LRR-repeat protein 7-like n=1 Tax=Mytilus californianus TaxID=6549 RepID=UPI002246C153|nr:F-box/LRR-repeat protein 7-like [Mytilus californianus]XP_052079060.1 F-box/LRR-repeat protein 7-like [Mytilus californianus]XP_052079061.1 F-box/LRR-repeat protein 7-like [Mytilus californianus]